MSRKAESLKTYIALKRSINEIESKTRKFVGSFGLNLNEFAVLEILYHKGKRTTQQIKEGILIANSSTTYIVDKLCDKGLVKREFAPEDRRVINVEITESGRKLMDELFPTHAEQLTANFDKLSEYDITEIRQLLKKMNGIKS
ncbi:MULTISPECIES: MarR family winged helix-turn-helix transcriptional regulator [Globicatella]|uniref:Transcriptional regulator, MarR family n=2 Tax=Globicatella sulfidifaciens TaxID=136093 RepID=A0A1T4N904_9LACT|nr:MULTISPECIES: MarR family winged helix-turn-helix transcriptional regulator [Globicatella]NLJ18591.1 winged helix-turn-helix transcriptional regulator [Globicatella sulfidifaciens]WPC08318.1 MarR family winged helix-turn-helix transcriptional regulator [Globicatella sp. PHS-GS-PNBC-21-1553]SJZ75780.1 transcriptional regulator, MarR family [Globicatella sulfidifaciens DSM 15739]HJF16535.1 MarR family winged helix-turn-helix transcriptional regulator [Globicatella sulfidifaciens]